MSHRNTVNSLGGIYARYALKLLQEAGTFESMVLDTVVCIASPHLGVRRPQSGAHSGRPMQETAFNFVFQTVAQSMPVV